MSDAPDITSGLKPPAPARLAALLVKHGVVTAPQIEAAQALQDGEHANLTKALQDLGFVKEPALISFLVKQLKIPHLNLQDYQITGDALKILPHGLCTRYRVLPIDILGKNLTLAMVNPMDESALAAVRQSCPEYRLKLFLCSNSEFDLVTHRLFGRDSAEKKDGGGMSLDSLGLSAAPRRAAPLASAPAPRPAQVPPDDEAHDPTATMLLESATPRHAKPAAPLRSSLICLDGWELGREIELTGNEHMLGRSPDADTTVNSPLVSREHARITRNEEYGQETFVVTDLKSSNGTFVNNIPITATILRHGDRVMLGNVLFKFVLLDEIEARFHKDVHHLYSIHKESGLLPAEAWEKELGHVIGDPAYMPLTACLIEIDHLARIAQTHGHIASVIVMSDISDLLEKYLDKSDLPGDFGDRRIAVMFGGNPLESVFPKLEDLRRTVEAYVFHHKDDRFRTTISVGLAVAPRGSDGDSFLASLRSVLGEAVAQGGNTVAVQH